MPPEGQENGLFARDLKHLVDHRYAVVPRRARFRGRRWVTAGLVGALGLYGWLANANSPAVENAAVTAAATGAIALPSRELEGQPPGAGPLMPAVEPVPDVSPLDAEIELDPEPELTWKSHTVKRGDTLGRIFRGFGHSPNLALKLVADTEGKRLRRLMPGRELRFGYDDEDALRMVSYDLGTHEWLHAEIAEEEEISVSIVPADLEVRERIVGGSIRSSLFSAGARAGLSDKLIMQLVGVFGWDIDFALDLRAGDRFIVIYEELFEDGKRVGTGDIVAAKFVNQGRSFNAFRHTEENGGITYYDAEGDSLRGTFLRTPVKLSRITSRFSRSRFHPVLKKWRAHKGVDYSAPRGTPVLATADGKVKFVGRKGGYGKTIVLRHGGTYSTLYAHLSSYKKGLRSGSKVQQGDVIGFIGSTGVATGPHLHYEFRVNGVHRNPLTHKSPRGKSLPEDQLEAFTARARSWAEKMAVFAATQLAKLD